MPSLRFILQGEKMPHGGNRAVGIPVTLGIMVTLLGAALTLGGPPMATRARAATGGTPGRLFDRIFIIVLENTNYGAALQQPFLRRLTTLGALFTDFHAITHPSYPNYLAMVAGSPLGTTDNRSTDLDATSLVDLFKPAGVAWKVYAENLPSPCFTGTTSPDGLYVRSHEPYISFRNIQANRARCERIVNAVQLQDDLAREALPEYSLYVPNLRNDGHDTGVAYADVWLQAFLSPLLQRPAFAQNALVVVTFDENAGARGNQIYTAFVGPMVRPGATNGTRHDHYSLLRTIEENYGVGTLGREDAKATAICCVWKR
jgi:hypothetical protein